MKAFRLVPEYREYVWGGMRLRPGQLTAEAWVVYEGDRIASGPLAGQTLGQAALEQPEAILGSIPMARTGSRFPLLIKLLDCAAWLSVQVHPNDEQAARLAGAGQFGKTEAWHFFQAEPGASVLGGVRPGTSPEMLAAAIRAGRPLLDVLQRIPVAAGDTLFIPAGMIHALGPGLLLYEVQQTSDITYRVYDWDRPASAGRPLHIEQSLAATDPTLAGRVVPLPQLSDGGRKVVAQCKYFTLELVKVQGQLVRLDPGGKSFHALTVKEGRARVAGRGWADSLGPLETLLVPASAGPYRLEPEESCQLLLAYLQ